MNSQMGEKFAKVGECFRATVFAILEKGFGDVEELLGVDHGKDCLKSNIDILIFLLICAIIFDH